MASVDSIWEEMKQASSAASTKGSAKAKTGFITEKDCGASREKPKKSKKDTAAKKAPKDKSDSKVGSRSIFCNLQCSRDDQTRP